MAALVAVLVCAFTAVSVLGSPSEGGTAQAAKKKGKGKKKRKQPQQAPAVSDTAPVVFVGNNWEGTADVLKFTLPSEPAGCQQPAKGKKKAKKGAEAAGKKRRGCKRAKRKGKKSAEAAAKKKRACKKGKSKRKGKKSAEAAKKKRGPCRGAGSSSGASFTRIARLNIIPDIQQRTAEIFSDPVRLVYFLAIRLAVGEGNDQFVDDMYSTKDGRLLIVSRPSLRDVIALDIASGKIVWRFVVAGQRSDHMAISPDGKHVAVSASTGNVVHILDTQTGQQVGVFPSGDSPHENTYSRDGSKIYHASIGLVYTPADQPIVDTTKGARYFQVVDANTNAILKRVDMGEKLAEAGYPNMSSAVRPMAISPDERFVYLQVSFFHGFVEYDLLLDKVIRVANLPNLVPNLPREAYLLDSAHHGIAINGDGNKLCVAGTMSDYAAIVSRNDFAKQTIIQAGTKPYWSTTDSTGKYCLVSWSGTDAISAIDYGTEKEIARIDVGDHPQRIRMGEVRKDWIQSVGGTP